MRIRTVERDACLGGGPKNARPMDTSSAAAMQTFDRSGAVTVLRRLWRAQRAAASAAPARARNAVSQNGTAAPIVAAVRIDWGTTWVKGVTVTLSCRAAFSTMPVASRPVWAAEK